MEAIKDPVFEDPVKLTPTIFLLDRMYSRSSVDVLTIWNYPDSNPDLFISYCVAYPKQGVN